MYCMPGSNKNSLKEKVGKEEKPQEEDLRRIRKEKNNLWSHRVCREPVNATITLSNYHTTEYIITNDTGTRR